MIERKYSVYVNGELLINYCDFVNWFKFGMNSFEAEIQERAYTKTISVALDELEEFSLNIIQSETEKVKDEKNI
jgi:hypothetical protein